MATKLSKADADIARTEILAVIAEETAAGTRYFEETYNLHVRAGRAYWNAFLAVSGTDNATPQTTKFADINTALGVDKDHKFLGLRAMATLSEDYVAFRANAVTGNAFTVAKVEFTKSNPGKSATSFRAIAPQLRDIVNTANGNETIANRKPSAEKVAEAETLAYNKTVAWNYGYMGAFSGSDADGVKIEWPTADRNMIRGLLNRSHVDMAALRAIPKTDVELLRQLINGILDDVKSHGPTVVVVTETEPSDIEAKVNSRSKSKGK